MAMHKDEHMGYYVRNGEDVEWRNFSDGCVKTKVAGRGREAAVRRRSRKSRLQKNCLLQRR